MYTLKAAKLYLLSGAIALSFSGCEKEFLTNQETTARTNTNSVKQLEEGTDGYTDLPGGETLPYPTIIKQTYIPKVPALAHTKTKAWKITWPAYPAGTDEDKIPTMFSIDNGALNSFDYLNKADSMETYKTHFSLYYENRLIETEHTDLWAPLIYLDFYSVGGIYIDETSIKKINESPVTVEGWVKNNPAILESIYLDSDNLDYIDDEEDYQAGDMFIFRIYKDAEDQKYGVIRIVSMSPRVIEVYLAVPHNVIEEAGS